VNKILKTYCIDDLNFKCIACGEKIPTLIRKERRGNIESGDYEVDIEYYDTSKNGYFVRLDGAEVLNNQYKSLIGKLQAKEKSKAKAEIDKDVSNEEFRKIVEERLFGNIDKDYKSRVDSFDNFIHWFEKPLEDLFSQPRYAMTLPCTISVLKNTEALVKEKYVVDSGNEKVLRCKAALDINKLPKTLPFISNTFGFDFDSLKTRNLVFEFGHFSEFPLE
jgi:hypothetical protein